MPLLEELLQQALSAREANQLELALKLFQEATTLSEKHLESWFYLADTAQQLDLKDTALNAYQACIQIQPDCTPALINGAQVLITQNKMNLAWEWLEKAKRINPEDELLKETLGKLYFEQGDYEKAISTFEALAHQNQTAPEVFQNWGMALEAAGKLPEAEAVLKTGLNLFPHHALLHFHLSTVLLAQQKFQDGWVEYAWRFQSGLVPPRPNEFKKDFCTKYPNNSTLFFPNQLHKPTPNEFNLIIHEQGFGDTIQFSRVFWWLMENDYLNQEARWVIELPKALIRLFEHQLPQEQGRSITFIERAASGKMNPLLEMIESYEKQTQKQLKAVYSFMSLPSLLPEHELFQPQAAYLNVPDNEIHTAQDELSKNDSHVQHWMGWMPSGSPSNWAGKRRSIPDNIWIPIMQQFLDKHPDMGILWLSPDIDPESLIQLKHGLRASQVFCPLLKTKEPDFLETAKWLKTCKTVLSIDTAVAHLAGALGIPTTVLLPDASDWRWFLPPKGQFRSSPWYPSIRMLRQTQALEWREMLEQALAHYGSTSDSAPSCG